MFCFVLQRVAGQAPAGETLKVSNAAFALLKEASDLSAGKATIYLTVTTHEDLATEQQTLLEILRERQ